MIRNIIKRITTQEQRNKAVRILNRMRQVKPNENIKKKYYIVAERNKDIFFGYYDINPFCQGKMLYLKVNSQNDCDICYRDNDGNETLLGSTNAWCWQQGCRVRWLNNDGVSIIWNDFQNNRYFSQIYDINKKEMRELPNPLYDISRDGRNGITLDFTRLGYLRPGYGYTNMKMDSRKDLENEGIDYVDIITGKSVRILTYKRIIESLRENVNIKECYINHLSFSPDGKRFIFFFLTKGVQHKARLLLFDISNNNLVVLEEHLSVSHYCWRKDNELLVTAYDENRRCRYYMYGYDGSEWKRTAFLHDLLLVDGHPTWINDNYLLTDTYPDDAGFQKVLLVDTVKRKCEVLADMYSTSKHMGEKRTDLHPRFDPESLKVCFDVNSSGNRKCVVIELSNLDTK